MVAESVLYLLTATMFFLMLAGFGAAFYAFSNRTIEVKPLAEDMETISGNVLRQLSKENSDYLVEKADSKLQVYDSTYADFREKIKKFEEDKSTINVQYIQIDQTLENLNPTLNRHTAAALKIHNAMTAEIGTRGRWGEGQVKVTLDSMGMVEDVHYLNQPRLKPYAGNADGTNPDFTVLLPGGGGIAIDSKAIMKQGFEAFYSAEEEEDDVRRNELLRTHSVNIWNHMKSLAERDYPLGLANHLGQQGPQLTIMFVPGRAFLERAYQGVSANLKRNMGGDFYKAAADKRIMLVDPGLLPGYLSLVMQQWDSSKVAEDVREYMTLASALLDEVIEVYETWGEVGDHIGGLTQSYNKAVKKTESTDRRGSSIRTAVDDLKALGAKPTRVHSKGKERGEKKDIMPLNEIHITAADMKGLTPIKAAAAEAEEEE